MAGTSFELLGERATRHAEAGNWDAARDDWLAALVDRLRARQFVLLDTQWTTGHLEQFGAIDISRTKYMRMLSRALELDCSFL